LPQRGQGVADIFVSYTSSDRQWAFWIGQELLKLGHAAHLHDGKHDRPISDIIKLTVRYAW
jgi:hypothetical protein